MKKHILFAIGLMLTVTTTVNAQQEDPVLMTIDNKEITKSEFLQIFLKNNDDPKYDKATLDNYMTLFKDFQLKVAEAEALGYDTIPRLVRELSGYQKQLAQPFLTDAEMNKTLIKQAYERMKNEVRASHILIRLGDNASPEDTLKAYNKIMEIRKKALNGGDFNKLAQTNSEDPSAKTNNGDLGFFTAFQMVYPFEEAAYTHKVGEISMPIRTRFGYHILKVTDKRPARGMMTAAHIMIAANQEKATKEDIERAKMKANELYKKLQEGADFGELTKKFSDDPSSAQKDGLLPNFGTGTKMRMVPEFEDAAFALKNNGDFSKPVQTQYGFHIIKRIDLTPLKSFEELKSEIEDKVSRDKRSEITRSSYINKLKKAYNFKNESEGKLAWFEKNLDSSVYFGKYNTTKIQKTVTLFELAGKTYTNKDFIEYINQNARYSRRYPLNEIASNLHPTWIDDAVIEYEKTQLPKKHPEYKALMQEYHDGILLYEIMSDKVWNKAIKDTVGLEKFYEANKANYMWNDRYDAVVYEVISEDLAKQVYKLAKKGKISSDSIRSIINQESELNLRIRSEKFEVSKTPYLKDRQLDEKVNKVYPFDGKYYVIDLKEIIPASYKKLSEAKGLITSDYQAYLEDQWLKELREKHTIKINNDILYSLGK